jgi:peptide/nickel transport system permease protein
MLGSVARRLVRAALVAAVASVVVYALGALLGDPIAHLEQSQPPPSQAELDAERSELHLDRSEPVRYLAWLGDFVTGDWGTTPDGASVRSQIGGRLGASTALLSVAFGAAALASIVIGVSTAERVGSRLDRLVIAVSVVVLSIPAFWLAALLQAEVGDRLDDLAGTPGLFTGTAGDPGGTFGRLGDGLAHLLLPALTLALLLAAAWNRVQRGALLEAADRAPGTDGSDPGPGAWRALWPPSVPIVVEVVVKDVAVLVGVAMVVERVFAWKGMGVLFFDAVEAVDVVLVRVWLMLSVLLVLGVGIVLETASGIVERRSHGG